MANNKKKLPESNEKVDLTDIKEELENYIDIKIRKEFNEELERTHKKILREKNLKIFYNRIIIAILLVLIVYLVFLLCLVLS